MGSSSSEKARREPTRSDDAGDEHHDDGPAVAQLDGHSYDDDEALIVSNEYVLNVAFLSFLGFTTLQLFFALIAKSQAMLADCAAMYVDVLSYLVNYLAERLKHGHSHKSPREFRLHRLYLELVPPLVSVATLIGVTVVALQQAFETLLKPDPDQSQQPNVVIMLLFSAGNLLLDFLNVACFARVDQAIGLPGQHGNEHVHVHYDHHENDPVDESTSLIRTESEETEECEVESKGLNLNMCSAWTHICADTLRSIAVLVAAGFSYLFPSILTPVQADSWGAIVVSVIILVSLAPLIQGLYLTACKIRAIWKGHPHSDHSKDFVVNV